MSGLAGEAELVKLGRVLGVEPEALAFLDGAAPAELRSLRSAVHALTFGQNRTLFERLASLVEPFPTRLTAMLAQRGGPLLTARVAGEIAPRRAAAVAARLPVAFRADVSAELDPRRTAELIGSLPVARIVEVALVLVERGDHVTLSRFVDLLPDTTVGACMEAIEDEAALLRIAYFVSSKERLGQILGLMTRARRKRLVQCVADDPDGLWRPFASLLAHGGEPLRRELAEFAQARLSHDDAARVDAAVAAELRALDGP